MARLAVRLIVLAASMLIPATLCAQDASITGTVRDTSVAVLPGVTVEASSPALIEKVRTVVSDGTGQYRIVSLRPGTYAVIFTLAGFRVVKREGIELTGSFTAAVNAEMRVGAIEETVTVTGASPIVDVQNVRQQRTLTDKVVAAIPSARTPYALAALIPGANYGGTTVGSPQDVGGTASIGRILPTVHGSNGVDSRIQNDGFMVGGYVQSTGGFQANIGSA